MKKIAIIGSGFFGVACALILSKRNKIHVYEKRKTILKYLSSRPYAEVFQLVAMLVGLKSAENGKKKEDEKKEI